MNDIAVTATGVFALVGDLLDIMSLPEGMAVVVEMRNTEVRVSAHVRVHGDDMTVALGIRNLLGATEDLGIQHIGGDTQVFRWGTADGTLRVDWFGPVQP